MVKYHLNGIIYIRINVADFTPINQDYPPPPLASVHHLASQFLETLTRQHPPKSVQPKERRTHSHPSPQPRTATPPAAANIEKQ